MKYLISGDKHALSDFVRRVTQNTLLFFSSQVWEAIASILIVTMLARYLGVVRFGSYAFVFSVVNLVVPLTFMGIEQVGIRELARKNDDSERGRYLGSLLQSRIALLGAAALIVAVILISLKPERNIIYGVVIFFIAIAIGSSGEVITSAFIAGERFQYKLYVLVVERLSLLVLIALVVLFDIGFLGIFVCYIVSKSLKTYSAYYFLNKYFYRVAIDLKLAGIKDIIKESYIVGFGISFAIGYNHAIVIIMKQVAGAMAAGIYTAYYTPVMRIAMFSSSLSRSLMPRISVEATSDIAQYCQLTKRGILLLFLAGMMVALVMWPFKGLIIKILYGSSFMIDINGFGYLIFLLPFLFIETLLNVALISKGLVKSFAFSKIAGFAVGVGVAYVLAMNHGFYGGIIGIISGNLVGTGIMFIVFMKIVLAFNKEESSLVKKGPVQADH